MTDGEKFLLAMIVDYAGDRMTVAGCNDTPESWLSHFSDKQLAQLHSDMDKWNDPSGLEEPSGYTRHNRAPDWFYASYFQSKLLSSIK